MVNNNRKMHSLKNSPVCFQKRWKRWIEKDKFCVEEMEMKIMFFLYYWEFSRWRRITRLSLRSTTALPTGNLQSECWNNCASLFLSMRPNFQSLGNKPNPVLGLLRSDRPGQLWALRDQGVHAVLGPDHVRHVLHHQHHRPAQPAHRHDEPLLPAHLSQLGEWTIYQKLRKGSFLQQKLMFCRNMSQNWMTHVKWCFIGYLEKFSLTSFLGGMSFSQFCLSFKLICLK